MNRVKVKIMGITFSQVQAGAYALILKEVGGSRRIPIIIGTPEAQSIAIFLEGLLPPRPLTHDLFISLVKAAGIKLKYVDIYKYEDGVFFSRIVFENRGNDFAIDARTSDAIALGIRTDAPMLVTEDVMREVSIDMEDDDDFLDELENANLKSANPSLDSMNLEDLQKNLNDAIVAEDYEKASTIRDLINKKTGKI